MKAIPLEIKYDNKAGVRRLGFTLIELLVVIGIIALLAAMLLPALAAAKARAQRMQCTSQMRQLGMGIINYTADHNEMYPPSGYATGDYMYQISWDAYINRYIGGTAPDSDLQLGAMAAAEVPAIVHCPADIQPITIDWATYGRRRSYAMVYAVHTVDPTEPLPPPVQGVGVFWQTADFPAGELPNWDPIGYRTSVVRDNSGTILLCEMPNGENIANNCAYSWCTGPGPGGVGGRYQTSIGLDTMNFGSVTKGLHGGKFNYLFHDGHVQVYRPQDTVGTATGPSAGLYPKGMWTITPGD